jgi:hypothetical protein
MAGGIGDLLRVLFENGPVLTDPLGEQLSDQAGEIVMSLGEDREVAEDVKAASYLAPVLVLVG